MSRSRTQRRGPSGRPPAAAPTLAAMVRRLTPGTSWEQARSLCRAGRVWVDGRQASDPAWRPGIDCRVEVLPAGVARARERGEAGGEAAAAAGEPREKEEGAAAAGGAGLGEVVVYADADVVVVRKPAGMLTVPFERGDRDTLLAVARVELRRREARRAARRPDAPSPPSVNPTLRAVQRLDKETSGLLVFARNVTAQRALQAQLARREVTRRYEALVHGAAPAATYETWLVDDRGDGLRGSWRARQEAGGGGPPGRRRSSRAPGRLAGERGAEGPRPPAGARHAVTHVRVLEPLRGATRIACELDTGRQHQIRIHLAEAGHPLLGETVYIRDYEGPRLPAPRPMLHAAVLGFRHPRDGRPLRFEEPPPQDFADVLRRLRRPQRSTGGGA